MRVIILNIEDINCECYILREVILYRKIIYIGI